MRGDGCEAYGRPLDSECHGWRWWVRPSSVTREAQAVQSKRSGCVGKRVRIWRAKQTGRGRGERQQVVCGCQRADKASQGSIAKDKHTFILKNERSFLPNHCIWCHVLHIAFCIFTSLVHYKAYLAICWNVDACPDVAKICILLNISHHGWYRAQCPQDDLPTFLTLAFIYLWMPFLDMATTRL